jgi:hypothetical protein
MKWAKEKNIKLKEKGKLLLVALQMDEHLFIKSYFYHSNVL